MFLKKHGCNRLCCTFSGVGRKLSAIRSWLQVGTRPQLDSRWQHGREEHRQRDDRQNLEGQRSRVQTFSNIWQLRDLTILQSHFITNLHGTVDQINTCLIDTAETAESFELQFHFRASAFNVLRTTLTQQHAY